MEWSGHLDRLSSRPLCFTHRKSHPALSWTEASVFEALLKLYEQSIVNPREPRCVFAETDLFNEGWLLRGVLAAWRAWDRPSNCPFLPFPPGSVVRSSAQLYTPFKKRKT